MPAMGGGPSLIACLLSFLASSGFPSDMAPDGANRLVLVEAPTSRLSAAGREHLRTAIGEVVARHGLILVPSETLSDKLLRCEPADCLSQIAAASGAGLVLRVDAKYAKESFELGVELWNSELGSLLGREGRTCPICDEQDLWGSAALLVQGLLERYLHKASRSGEQANASEAPAPPARVPLAAPAAHAEHAGNWVGYGGFALAAAGASVMGIGIYYLAVDGNPTCEACDFDRDTAKYGQPMAIAGGLALAGGAAMLLWRFWPSAPAVSLAPSGVLLTGRF